MLMVSSARLKVFSSSTRVLEEETKVLLQEYWPCSFRLHIYTASVYCLKTHKTHTPLQAVLEVDGGLEPIDGEGDNAGKDGGSTVDERNNDGLALKVVVVVVVAGKSYECPKTQTQREKDLSGRIDPCSRVGKLFHLNAHIHTHTHMHKTLHITFYKINLYFFLQFCRGFTGECIRDTYAQWWDNSWVRVHSLNDIL